MRAIATFAPKKDADVELEYESSLGDGRSLSANVNPSNGNGEIEYVDSATLDAAYPPRAALFAADAWEALA